jgi:hypothetical protein
METVSGRAGEVRTGQFAVPNQDGFTAWPSFETKFGHSTVVTNARLKRIAFAGGSRYDG